MRRAIVLFFGLLPLLAISQTVKDTAINAGPRMYQSCQSKNAIIWQTDDRHGFLERTMFRKYQGTWYFSYEPTESSEVKIQVGFKAKKLVMLSVFLLAKQERAHLVFCPNVSPQVLENTGTGDLMVPGYGSWEKFSPTGEKNQKLFWDKTRQFITALFSEEVANNSTERFQ